MSTIRQCVQQVENKIRHQQTADKKADDCDQRRKLQMCHAGNGVARSTTVTIAGAEANQEPADNG